MRLLLWRLAPPLALMALIFFLSAQPGLSSGLSWDFYLRKVAHMAVFGLLALLWWRALGYRRMPVAVAITFLYAVADEVHQSFVPDRHGSPVDVAIDMVGVAVAVVVSRVIPPRWRK